MKVDTLAQTQQPEEVKQQGQEGQAGWGLAGLGGGYSFSNVYTNHGYSLGAWHGLGGHVSFSHPDLIWEHSALSLSADASVGMYSEDAGGSSLHAGVGPAIFVGERDLFGVWGAVKARVAGASPDGYDGGFWGWGFTPEVGMSLYCIDVRLGLPGMMGGGDARPGYNVSVGYKIGLP